MATVADILREKGSRVHTIHRTSTAFEALAEMIEHKIGSLIVMDKERPCGIFTERDYLRRVAVLERDPHTAPIERHMTSRVRFVKPTDTVEECMAIVTEARIRHLPVMEGDRLVGVVSIGDLVKLQVQHQRIEIEDLTGYIVGR